MKDILAKLAALETPAKKKINEAFDDTIYPTRSEHDKWEANRNAAAVEKYKNKGHDDQFAYHKKLKTNDETNDKPVVDEAKPNMMAQVYPDTKQGVLQYMQYGYSAKFLKDLDLPTCKIHPDQSVEGVWAVDSMASGHRCIIYLAGYKDPWGNKREFNDNEEGGFPLNMMKRMVQNDELTPKLMQQWVKRGGLDEDDMAKLMKIYNDYHGVDESVNDEFDDFLGGMDDEEYHKYATSDLPGRNATDKQLGVKLRPGATQDEEPMGEAMNHMGEREYNSFHGWRAAAKKAGAEWFDGDVDIAQAMKGPRPYVKGVTHSVGEWDGNVGSIYSQDPVATAVPALDEAVARNTYTLQVIEYARCHNGEGTADGYLYDNETDEEVPVEVEFDYSEGQRDRPDVDGINPGPAEDAYAEITRIVDENGLEIPLEDVSYDDDVLLDAMREGLHEGAKVDRMVKHIKSSEKKLGKSGKEAENIAWATANKRGMLDNKNKKTNESKADPTGSWVAYKSPTVFKKFKTREGMKKFIASHEGYKSASSEHFADTIQKKTNEGIGDVVGGVKKFVKHQSNMAKANNRGWNEFGKGMAIGIRNRHETDPEKLAPLEKKVTQHVRNANRYRDFADGGKGFNSTRRTTAEKDWDSKVANAKAKVGNFASKVKKAVTGESKNDIKESTMRTYKIVTEGQSFSVHNVHLAKILRRFPHELAIFRTDGELDDHLYEALFDHYFDEGEMPYGTAKARDGDPYEWVANRLEGELSGKSFGHPNDARDFAEGAGEEIDEMSAQERVRARALQSPAERAAADARWASAKANVEGGGSGSGVNPFATPAMKNPAFGGEERAGKARAGAGAWSGNFEGVGEGAAGDVMVEGDREVDYSTIEIDGVDRRDHPDYADAYISYAEYTDGTPLSDDEIEAFNNENGELINQLANEQSFGEGIEEDSVAPEVEPGEELITEGLESVVTDILTNVGLDHGLDFFFDDGLVIIGRSTARVAINALKADQRITSTPTIGECDGEECRITFGQTPDESINSTDPELDEAMTDMQKWRMAQLAGDTQQTGGKQLDLNKDYNDAIRLGDKQTAAAIKQRMQQLAAQRMKSQSQDTSTLEFSSKKNKGNVVSEDVNLSITADGQDDVVNVIRKLSGLGSDSVEADMSPLSITTAEPTPSIGASSDMSSMIGALDAIDQSGDPADDEQADIVAHSGGAANDDLDETEYDNEPDPQVYATTQQQMNFGDKSQQGRRQPMTQPGNNPMAEARTLMRQYETLLRGVKAK